MNPLAEATKLISDFRIKHSEALKLILELAEKLQEACGKVERSWSGSFAGWHGRMYFRNFQTPSIYERFSGEWGGINGIPDGWEEKQPEEVRDKIDEFVGSGFSAENFEKEVKNFRKEAEDLRNEVAVVFSSFSFSAGTEKEKELFDQLEKFEFGKTKGEFIKNHLPGTMMSRDSEAMRQGICIASWLYYEGVAAEGKNVCEATENFLVLSTRLIRQLEIKSNMRTPAASKDKSSLSSLHPDIYTKCNDLYKKGAYAEAVEKGFKVVRDRLRRLTGYETGSEAFGRGKLHVKGAAAANVDIDFNEAVKFLTMAIDRFRNEKSHTSDAKIDDSVRAYEYLRLSSLALNLLEDTEILP
jgi:uncharacterized protein (TIGR02391 family)